MSAQNAAGETWPASAEEQQRRAQECHCDEALARLEEYLDSEVAELDAARLQAHVDDCASCLTQVALEQKFRALLRRSCTEVAPDTLRVRVRSQITIIRLAGSRPQL